MSTQSMNSWPNPNDEDGPGGCEGRITVAVVIPAYQAEKSVAQVVRGFAARANWVIVVDDASSDGTSERVRALNLPNVVLLRHERNRGVGGAMKTGIVAAQERGVDIVVKADADDQMDPAYFDVLLEPLLQGAADVSKGNRWYDRAALGSMPRARRYGNVALAFMTRLASGHWRIFDPNNGYLAWRTDLLRIMDFNAIPERYTFEAGMLIEIGMLGGLVRDVPIPARYGSETSYLRVQRALFEFPRFLARGAIRRLWMRYFVYDFTAVSLFLVSGLLFMAFGVSFGTVKWIQSVSTGVPATAGTVILAALPVLMGFNLLLQALILDIQSVPDNKLCRDLRGGSA